MRDYSVSGEDFTLEALEDGSLLRTITSPLADMSKYYESQDYISHTDGARNLFEKVYQWVKAISLRNKVKMIGKHVGMPGNILDIGCGTGDFLVHAKSEGWKIQGVEPNPTAAGFAARKGVLVQNNTAGLPQNTFNVITMWHVLEHVPDPEAQFVELLRLLKPEGLLVIAVPNFKSLDAQHYGPFWAAFDVPRHLWHFSQKAISNLASRHQMKVVQTLPMWFDAFYVSLLSEKYRHGKIRPVQGLWQGLRSNLSALRTGECSSQIYLLKRN